VQREKVVIRYMVVEGFFEKNMTFFIVFYMNRLAGDFSFSGLSGKDIHIDLMMAVSGPDSLFLL
jgi:hypothetical protein